MDRNKMKVLIIGSDLSVKGGITSVINRFLQYKWSNVEIDLLPTYIEGNCINKILFFYKSLIIYIYRLIKSDFNIAHIHMSYKGSFFRKYLIVKLSKLFNKKVILHLHGSEFELFYNSSNKTVKNMIKSLFEISDCVLVLGDSWYEIIKNIAPGANIKVFNNAVNIPREKVSWSENKVNILFLGVLIERKGVYELIEAIKVLTEENIVESRNLNFIIGGTGKEEANVSKLITQHNLDKNIEMLGWVDNELKESLLKKSQLLILPSHNEGLPMAILEAMSYGIPVIATNVGSISEVVIKDKTGILIEPKNVKSIVNAIIEITKSPRLWEYYSKQSKHLIELNFNELNYFKEIESLYEQIIIG